MDKVFDGLLDDQEEDEDCCDYQGDNDYESGQGWILASMLRYEGGCWVTS